MSAFLRRRLSIEGGGRLAMSAVRDGDPANEVRPEPLGVPGDAYLFLNQAFDNWAVLAASVLAGPGDHDAKVIYPDLHRVYEVHFKLEREEKVDLGRREAPLCRLYSFASKEGQFAGEVWVDARGRLVQHRQGELTVYLEE